MTFFQLEAMSYVNRRAKVSRSMSGAQRSISAPNSPDCAARLGASAERLTKTNPANSSTRPGIRQMTRRRETTGEVIRPCVVRAHQAAGRPCARQQLVCSVLTHVVERSQRTAGVADHEHGHARHLTCHIATGPAQLLGVAPPLPRRG